MNSDKIDLASIPGLDVSTGMYGSVIEAGAYNDITVAILVLVYDVSAFAPSL